MRTISLVEIKNVKKYFDAKSSNYPVKAVDKVNLTINKGEVLGLIGESGSGKSTLGKLILGLEEPTEGQVLFKNKDVVRQIKTDRKAYYKKVQMIFQNPYDVFDDSYTIDRSLKDTLKIHEIAKGNEDLFLKDMLESFAIKPAEDFLKRYPKDLSGGQLQRIAILRSMVLEPDFLVADEPVTMLDVSVRSEIIKLLLKAKEMKSTSILFISHDIATTSFISDRLAVMYLGQIVEESNASQLIDTPLHPYTKALLSYTNSIFSDRKKDRLKIKQDQGKNQNLGEKCYFSSRCYKASDKCFKQMPELEDIGSGRKVRCFYFG